MNLLRRLLPLRLCAVALLGSLLFGVQLLQASPLHEHAGHTVQDCSIGHLPTTDAPLSQVALQATSSTLVLERPESCAQHFSHRRAAPYQGRAPPR